MEFDDFGESVHRRHHPHNVAPLGQQFLACNNPRTSRSALGAFAILSDDALLALLNEFNDATIVARLAACTPALYAFCADESLWKSLTLLTFHSDWQWVGASWRTTFLTRASNRLRRSPLTLATVSARGLYSDVLFASFLARHAAFDHAWVARDTIERRNGAHLTRADFVREFEAANRPVLIEGVVSEWPAVQKWSNRHYLLDAFGSQPVHARGTDMPLQQFLDYCDANEDEMPLYVFDKAAFDKVPQLGADFTVPPQCAGDDCFELLDPAVRPSFRWLLIGQRRSGSAWHKDPNFTNAWNATIVGHKKWILLPPSTRPPGVFCDRDEVEVTVPLSIVEWFMQFYSKTSALRPIEVVTKPGDLLFVPRGWWHTALNLDYCIAVTQNYAPASSVLGVIDWLERHPENSSGTRLDGTALAGAMRQALEQQRPGLLESLQAAREKTMFGATQKTFRFGFGQDK